MKDEFLLGCNYWASHAGTNMWENWNFEAVEADLKALSEYGMNTIRVFPLWPVFQPIHMLYTGGGAPMEYRMDHQPLRDTIEGRAGVSAVAIRHFEELITIAGKYKFKIIVGLITGWMSGRLFVPPALEKLNILTDPVAIMWQVRFVKYFVSHFINAKEIIGWDLGNECNCMGEVESREEAWNWTCSISDAIRSVDNTRPVISGMHSLTTNGKWTIQDQAELTDLLTTHPYPIFTPYCDNDPVNTIRTGLHSACESMFYANIGNRPCMVEEIGTLGPMVASNAIAADFGRMTMFSAWAHGCNGYLWWCAFDQKYLNHAPYDWFATERELGLMYANRQAKPVAEEMKNFSSIIRSLPLDTLPHKINDCVCILSHDQDAWGVAYSSFVLGKQAGMDMEFAFAEQPLKNAPLYLLPCIRGHRIINRRRWQELKQRVYDGAVLYISYDGGFLSEFEEFTGVRIESRYKRMGMTEATFRFNAEETALHFEGEEGLALLPQNADVIGNEQNGNPAFTCASYGKGKVFFLAVPLEIQLSKTPGVFQGSQPYFSIYSQLFDSIQKQKYVIKQHPMIGVTEHIIDENARLAILINYSDSEAHDIISIADGWKINDCYYGTKPHAVMHGWQVEIKKNDVKILFITKD